MNQLKEDIEHSQHYINELKKQIVMANIAIEDTEGFDLLVKNIKANSKNTNYHSYLISKETKDDEFLLKRKMLYPPKVDVYSGKYCSISISFNIDPYKTTFKDILYNLYLYYNINMDDFVLNLYTNHGLVEGQWIPIACEDSKLVYASLVALSKDKNQGYGRNSFTPKEGTLPPLYFMIRNKLQPKKKIEDVNEEIIDLFDRYQIDNQIDFDSLLKIIQDKYFNRNDLELLFNTLQQNEKINKAGFIEIVHHVNKNDITILLDNDEINDNEEIIPEEILNAASSIFDYLIDYDSEIYFNLIENKKFKFINDSIQILTPQKLKYSQFLTVFRYAIDVLSTNQVKEWWIELFNAKTFITRIDLIESWPKLLKFRVDPDNTVADILIPIVENWKLKRRDNVKKVIVKVPKEIGSYGRNMILLLASAIFTLVSLYSIRDINQEYLMTKALDDSLINAPMQEETGKQVTRNFYGIDSQDTFWEFMQSSFLNYIFSEQPYDINPDYVLSSQFSQYYNELVPATLQIRQLRVKKQQVSSDTRPANESYAAEFGIYPKYTIISRSNASFIPSERTDVDPEIPQTLIDAGFVFSDLPVAINQQDIPGYFSVYDASGFTIDFNKSIIASSNDMNTILNIESNTNRDDIQTLSTIASKEFVSKVLTYYDENNWLDNLTRGVVVSFVLLNRNLNLFTGVQLLVEWSPSGWTKSSYQIKSFTTNFEDSSIAFQWVATALIAIAFLLNLSKLYKKHYRLHKKKLLFESLFNLTTISFITAVIIISKMVSWQSSSQRAEFDTSTPLEPFDVTTIYNNYVQISYYQSILVVLLSFLVLSLMFSMQATSNLILLNTFEKSKTKLSCLLFVYLIMAIGFSILIATNLNETLVIEFINFKGIMYKMLLYGAGEAPFTVYSIEQSSQTFLFLLVGTTCFVVGYMTNITALAIILNEFMESIKHVRFLHLQGNGKGFNYNIRDIVKAIFFIQPSNKIVLVSTRYNNKK